MHITSLHQLHNEVKVNTILERGVEGYDEWAIAASHQFGLVIDVLDSFLFFGNPQLVHRLECVEAVIDAAFD